MAVNGKMPINFPIFYSLPKCDDSLIQIVTVRMHHWHVSTRGVGASVGLPENVKARLGLLLSGHDSGSSKFVAESLSPC